MAASVCQSLTCSLLLIVLAGECPNLAAQAITAKVQKLATITDRSPSASFPVSPETLASRPPLLFVSITKVVNPERTPFEILVYLSRPARSGSKEWKALIGNFSLYPPDHPAAFSLSTANAFDKLATFPAKIDPHDVSILVEIKRINETAPWTHIEVILAPPEWRDDKKN